MAGKSIYFTRKELEGLGDFIKYLICVNGESDNFGEYTGICNEDDCNDGEEI